MPIPHFDLGCISKWHGIEKGMALNEKEVDFVVASIIGWIGEQLDELSWTWWLSEKPSEKLERNIGFSQFLQINSHKYSRSKILK